MTLPIPIPAEAIERYRTTPVTMRRLAVALGVSETRVRNVLVAEVPAGELSLLGRAKWLASLSGRRGRAKRIRKGSIWT